MIFSKSKAKTSQIWTRIQWNSKNNPKKACWYEK